MKLLMNYRENMTEKLNLFAKSFIEAQKEMGNATKDSKNPFFKSKYADLNSVREACLPALNAHGIAVLQPIVQVDGKNFVKTLLLHESGESMEGLTEILFAKQNDPQAQGSGITYARRYGLQSLVNIAAEDDDGNKAASPYDNPTVLEGMGVKRNASGLKVNTALTDGSAMQETQEEENKKQFARIKDLIENVGSSAELQGIWFDNAKQINSLKKYATALYDLLVEAKDTMKAQFIGE
tara:strand:+ start:2078 stop:2791 length:714 start_codon:yes stop_codon:yes gene_type:complete